MKRKKALAGLLGLMLALQPFVRVFAETAPMREAPMLLYAAPADLQHSAADAYLAEAEPEALPEKFNLCSEGLATAIKNQNPLGTCWAHATLGAIETCVIREDPFVDLSERHLATYVVSKEYGDGTEDMSPGNTFGNAAGLLTNWIGPVSEALAPYEEELTELLPRKTLQEQSEYHVTATRNYAYFAAETDDEAFWTGMEAVKRELCSGHAAYLSVDFVSDENSTIYNAERQESPSTPHAVLLVGYDDSFPAERFMSPPPADGAWIIKNSYGPEDGDTGFYYISYYDRSIMEIAFLDAVNGQLHDTLYSYDEYGSNGKYAADPDGDECVYMSNVYTAEEDGFVTDVMLFGTAAGDAYEVSVCTGLTDAADPASGEPHGTVTGTVPYVGYQTVTLSEPVRISAGEPFAVTAALRGEKNYRIVCECCPIDTGEEGVGGVISFVDSATSHSLVNRERVLETFAEGQSFVSTDGETWNDLFFASEERDASIPGNLCLRAMTVRAGKVLFSSYAPQLRPGTELVLSAPSGGNIYYSVDGGEYALYENPIPFTKEMTVSAYAEGYEDDIQQQQYAERKALCSSLLVKSYPLGEEGSASAFYADSRAEESEITVPWNAKEIGLIPMTEGTVEFGGAELHSNEELKLPCSTEPFTVTLTAEEEGLQPTKYTLHFSREVQETFAPGYWLAESRAGWYLFFEDGKTGSYTDRRSGAHSDFTYAVDGNTVSFQYKDSVRKAKLSSDEWHALLTWEDGSSEVLNLTGNGEFAPCYTVPELSAMAQQYAAAVYGISGRSELKNKDALAEITITAATGESVVFRVSDITGNGTDADGNVVALAKIPQTGFKLTAGIYRTRDQGGFPSYWYFGADGKECAYLSGYDAVWLKGEYSLQKGQLKVQLEGEEPRSALASAAKNGADVMWGSDMPEMFRTEQMEYVCAETAETFILIPIADLCRLAGAYFEAETCQLHEFNASSPAEDDDIMLFCTSEAEMFSVTVDPRTGKGTDMDGNEIDLMHFEDRAEKSIPAGIYRYISAYGTLYGFWHFPEDGTAPTYIGYYDGTKEEANLRRIGETGILYLFGQKQQVTVSETADGFLLEVPEGGAEQLLFCGPGTKESLQILSALQIAELVRLDYHAKTQTPADASTADADENGIASVNVIDRATYETIGTYLIDIRTGTGTDFRGKSVDLLKKIPKAETIQGDVNLDSFVNIADAVLLMRLTSEERVEPAMYSMANADMNGDGKITISDTALLLEQIAGYGYN